VGLQYRERKLDAENNPVTAHRVLLTGPPTVLSKGLPGLDPVEVPDLQLWLRKLAAYDSSQPVQVATEAADPVNPPQNRSRRRSR
jgi:hypothetical protein